MSWQGLASCPRLVACATKYDLHNRLPGLRLANWRSDLFWRLNFGLWNREVLQGDVGPEAGRLQMWLSTLGTLSSGPAEHAQHFKALTDTLHLGVLSCYELLQAKALQCTAPSEQKATSSSSGKSTSTSMTSTCASKSSHCRSRTPGPMSSMSPEPTSFSDMEAGAGALSNLRTCLDACAASGEIRNLLSHACKSWETWNPTVRTYFSALWLADKSYVPLCWL